MNAAGHSAGFLRELSWGDVLLVLAVIVGSQLLVLAVRWIVRQAAESAPSHRRLVILRTAPLARLAIGIAGIAIIVPILIEPTFENVVALVAAISLALAFALKDYARCLAAGIVTIIEHTYRPGDWIELDGSYGEVKAIGMRAVHLVTADDTEVIIPHSRLWSTSLFNASGGKQSLLCVTDFYLNANHDGAAVRQALAEIGDTSRLPLIARAWRRYAIASRRGAVPSRTRHPLGAVWRRNARTAVSCCGESCNGLCQETIYGCLVSQGRARCARHKSPLDIS